MLTVAVYGSRRQGEKIGLVDKLLQGLSEKGCRLVMHSKVYNYLREMLPDEQSFQNWNVYAVTDSSHFNADIVISLGGDGTLLRTAQWVGDKEIPIIGINTGHLGFMTAFELSDAEKIVELLFNREFLIEERALISVSIKNEPRDWRRFALNEIAVFKHDTASMVSVSAVIDNKPLATYLADGLIVATPTGSTGYNLSVGGPILQPTAPNFVISPIAAHSLTMRPLVISDQSELDLTTTSRSATYCISIDGKSYTLPVGTTVHLSKAHFITRIIQPQNHNFADALHDKLLWGER